MTMKIVKNLVVASLLVIPFASCTAGRSTGELDRASEGLEDGEGCALTQAYWRDHPEAWPSASVALGDVEYGKEQLLAVLHEPVRNNCLVSLAHQLIASKLNVANGADGGAIGGAIGVCDALIAGRVVPPIGGGALRPSASSELIDALDEFNRTGACLPPPAAPACGNGIVEAGEQCDDGNTDDTDACGNDCTLCPSTEPGCGNGVVEPGEECDDGNTTDGDGCSSTCRILIL